MQDDFSLSPIQDLTIPYNPITPSFSTQEELINAISSYFDAINQSHKAPTFNGLSLSLGLSRHQLKNFPKDSPLSPLIEKAKQYIADFAEQQLFSPKPSAGVAFWLKNNDDWVDKSDINITQAKTMKEIIDSIDQKNLSPIIYDQSNDQENV